MQQTRALAIQRPISQVLWPRSSLAGCILGTFVRDTRGCELTPAERMNFFSASPYCSVSWFIEGQAHIVDWSPAEKNRPPRLHCQNSCSRGLSVGLSPVGTPRRSTPSSPSFMPTPSQPLPASISARCSIASVRQMMRSAASLFLPATPCGETAIQPIGCVVSRTVSIRFGSWPGRQGTLRLTCYKTGRARWLCVQQRLEPVEASGKSSGASGLGRGSRCVDCDKAY